MSERKQFIPKEMPGGASKVGNSFVSLFAKCPQKWFNTYLRPIETFAPDGTPMVTQGIRPNKTALALINGSVFHEGMAALYLSGCRDGEDTGEWNLEEALAVARGCWKERFREFEETVHAEDEWTVVQTMLTDYCEWYGPNTGRTADFPNVRVAHDGEGMPLVEREFICTLPGSQHIYTMRADLVIEHMGYLKMGEHKTSVAGFVKQRLASAHTDPQMTGQCWVMRELFPDTPVNGVWMNVIVKGRSLNSKWEVAERDTSTRTDAQMDKFPYGVLSILGQIDESVGGFLHEFQKDTTDLEVLAQRWFPDHGTRTEVCYSYGRDCEYLPLCKGAGRESQILQNFRPRATVELKDMKEWTG